MSFLTARQVQEKPKDRKTDQFPDRDEIFSLLKDSVRSIAVPIKKLWDEPEAYPIDAYNISEVTFSSISKSLSSDDAEQAHVMEEMYAHRNRELNYSVYPEGDGLSVTLYKDDSYINMKLNERGVYGFSMDSSIPIYEAGLKDVCVMAQDAVMDGTADKVVNAVNSLCGGTAAMEVSEWLRYTADSSLMSTDDMVYRMSEDMIGMRLASVRTAEPVYGYER